MKSRKSKLDESKPIWLTFYCVVGFGLFLALLLQGADISLLNPMGLIAKEQRNLALIVTAILMLIAVPSLFFFYFFAWKYRETNEKATYQPDARHGKSFVFSVWAIPLAFMFVLIFIMIPATYKLEPRRDLASGVKPITIQVVAMRWKWLFIYPEQKIASVNFVQVPTGTPIRFELTADRAPMSSFSIPHLGGQLYAMTGHVKRLNLMAEKAGDYPGRNISINGAGFAGMQFIARAGSQEAYDGWVKDVQQNSGVLDTAEYEKLVNPSENNPAVFYTLADSKMYDKVVAKYMTMDMPSGAMSASNSMGRQ